MPLSPASNYVGCSFAIEKVALHEIGENRYLAAKIESVLTLTMPLASASG